MEQALYRKYRSTSLSEIVGQEPITTALQRALDTGRVSHAYLLTGPRGSGKTSVARIMAHAINNIPYSRDPHLDIIEIDAASNRRIDEIRDLRDKVYIAPSQASYKVYIIDEVHMLTREAFNALLKTLEEPPAHVVFILATTDAHKLPETIISRTQRYSFKPVPEAQVAAHLSHIAEQEGLTAEPAALTLLARHGQGSFRDSISMLDQAGNHGATITEAAVRSQLGIPTEQAIEELIDQLARPGAAARVTSLQKLFDQGFQAGAIAELMAVVLRQRLLEPGQSAIVPNSLDLLKQLLEVPAAHNPERYLEVVVLGVDGVSSVVVPSVSAPSTAQVQQSASQAGQTESAAGTPSDKPTVAAADQTAKPAIVTPAKRPSKATATPSRSPAKAAATAQLLTDENWSQVLAELKKQYNTIYGIVRMAHTDFSEVGRVTLRFAFAFHQKRISDPKNRQIVTDTIEQVCGQRVELHCLVAKEPIARPAATPTSSPSGDSLQDISSIFGGGELL